MLNRAWMIPVLAALIGITSALFALWPQLDLLVSGYFFDGTRFPVETNTTIEALRNLLWDLTIFVALSSIVIRIATTILRDSILGLSTQHWQLIVFTFVMGPGLLVNGVLKRYWGRARPADILQFGGSHNFTPPYQMADQCASNCSFVSGEVAATMALTVTMLLILSGLRRRLQPVLFRLGQGVAWALLALCALQRVAAGRHFLSDVILAALFVALIAAILARFFLGTSASQIRR